MSRNFLKQNHKKKKKTTKIKKRKKEGKDKEGKCRINQVDWLKWAFSDSVYERERESERRVLITNIPTLESFTHLPPT